MSIATTFIPEMARAVARRDKTAFIERTNLGIRLVGLLTFPAAFTFMVLARPIIGLLLQHGEFDAVAADNTARALSGLALGLIGYSIYLFALRGFYAHQDTRTPFVINCFQNVLNIILAFILSPSLDVLGLGLAFSISYVLAAVAAVYVLKVKVRGFSATEVLFGLLRLAAAAAAMGAVMWLVLRPIGANSGAGALTKVVVGSLVGALSYVGALTLMRAPEVEHLRVLRDRVRSLRTGSAGQ
jgi:putative peptidoglycan lipid II flippase